MSRKRVRRKTARTIFIACEGRNTEPAYFTRIKELVEDSGELALTIYPDETASHAKTDALGLIGEAQERAEEFDELWVVVDKNGYTKHAEAFALAQTAVHGKTVSLAFSSISFEQWVLLHFERSTHAFGKSEEIIEQKLASGATHFPGYSKRAALDIFPTLYPRTTAALEHAAWLRFVERKTLSQKPLYEANPYTDVDQLVIRLLGINSTFHWGEIGEWKSIAGVWLRVTNPSSHLLICELDNQGKSAFVSQEITYLFRPASSSEPLPFPAQLIEPKQAHSVEIPLPEKTTELLLSLRNQILLFEIPSL